MLSALCRADGNEVQLTKSELLGISLEDFLSERLELVEQIAGPCGAAANPGCKLDASFAAHLQELQFITPDYTVFYEHLLEGSGGSAVALPVHETSLMLVMEELIRIDSVVGPNEKLCCIFNFHHGLCDLLVTV